MSHEDDPNLSTTETDASTLVPDWSNQPSLEDLTQDYDSAQVAHHVHVDAVAAW